MADNTVGMNYGWGFYMIHENLYFEDMSDMLMCYTQERNTKLCTAVTYLHNKCNKS